MNNNYQSPMGGQGSMGQSSMGNQVPMGGMNPNPGSMNQPFGQPMMNQAQSVPQQPMMNQSFGHPQQSMMNQAQIPPQQPNMYVNQPFGQPQQPNMYNQPMMFPEQKKKSKVGLVIAIVVIFFVIFAVIGYFVGGPTPNYGVGDLKLYIPTDWSREDDTTYYNSDRTCRLIAGSNENYSAIEEKVSGVIKDNVGFTRSTKNINGNTWNYSTYSTGGEMMHIYWIEYKGTGYMIAIAGKDSGDCLEYKKDLEKSIKLK